MLVTEKVAIVQLSQKISVSIDTNIVTADRKLTYWGAA